MSKQLPYYKMYPADADTDENFRLMSYEQRGLYWTLLDHAWLNDGLPVSSEDLMALLRIGNVEFNRLWKRVSVCFPEVGDRRRNKRQEEERVLALSKSKKATDSVRSRYVRNTDVDTNVAIRAYVSVSESSEELKEKKDGEILPPELDEQFLEYQRLFSLVGNPIPEDFAAGSFCWRAWSILDFEQREAVVESLKVREAAGVQVLHSADNYISKREYKRPLRKATNGNGKPDILAEMLAEERAKRA